MPIGPFPDFDACVAHMTKPKEEGGGGYDEETARKVCGKMKAELEEGFSWAGDIRSYPGAGLIRGEAIHPVKTFHPYEWPQLRVFLEDELERSAETLVGKPLFLDHWRPLNGKILGAGYEDGALEYFAELNDEDVLQMIRDGQIKHASVQFEWKILENVDGVAPRGINFEHLSLLKDMPPGDPQTTVEIWESLARQLMEAKDLAPPNPQKGSETEKSKVSKKLKEQGNGEDEREKLRQAQKERAKKYGIGPKEGGHLTKPSEYEDVPEDQFADPVNYRYPITKKYAKGALTYFNQPDNRKAGGYTHEETAKIMERIIEGCLAAGVDATYQPEDPVYRDLPEELKKKLKGYEESSQSAAEQQGEELTVEQLKQKIAELNSEREKLYTRLDTLNSELQAYQAALEAKIKA